MCVCVRVRACVCEVFINRARPYNIFLFCSMCSIIEPPNPMGLPSQAASNIEAYLLPYILIWNPLVQFQTFFGSSVQCSRMDCKNKIHLVRWNVGCSDGHCPRLLHDLNHMILLVPAVYGCDSGHEVLSTDPYILKQFSEEDLSYSMALE